MIRAVIFACTAAIAAALHHSRVVAFNPTAPGVEPLPFADELARQGEATRVKSLSYEDHVFLARTIFGECARCGRDEQTAIIYVVINRLRTGRYGANIGDVVTFSRGRTFAFSTWSPHSASNFNEATGSHVTRHRLYGQIFGLIDEVWQQANSRGAVDPTDAALCYYHPHSMLPAGRVPSWALNRPSRRIGRAVFVRCRA